MVELSMTSVERYIKAVKEYIAAESEQEEETEDEPEETEPNHFAVFDSKRISASAFYTNYVEWCARNNQRPIDQTKFGSCITETNAFQKKVSNGVKYVIRQ